VRVPGSVERLLRNRDGKGVGSPTRFTLRVVVARRYGKPSARRNSPVIVSALRSGEPASCGNGSDFDDDLLSNAEEARIKTDPCDGDTDGDGVEDGFEQTSARDLNQRALPYPGQRAFANALDPSDAHHDYDGDGLSNLTEFRAWAEPAASPPPSLLQFYADGLGPDDQGAPEFRGPYGTRPSFGRHVLPQNYSDGLQASTEVVAGRSEWNPLLDIDDDGRLTDDERDVDGDGLSNFDERHPGGNPDLARFMSIGFYPEPSAPPPPPYPPLNPATDCGFSYAPPLPRPMLETGYMDTDSDGDGVWDGNDDQDGDGVSNYDEIKPPYGAFGEPPSQIFPLPYGGARDGSTIDAWGCPIRRSPYNPCLPYRSDTCQRHMLRP